MTGTFQEKTNELIREVGDDKLTGSVVINQVYAQNQHESVHFKHPHGGRAKYLETALRQQEYNMLRHLSSNLRWLRTAMIRNMETLSREAARHTPVLYGNLIASGRPMVKDNGALVYDRLPAQGRLSDAELKAQGRRTG